MRYSSLRAIWTAGLGGLAIACSPTIDTRGHVTDLEVAKSIRPGVHRQADVERLMGSPTTMSAFGPASWIYINRKTERSAFFQPEVLDQRVTIVRFDEGGLVSAVERIDMDAIQEVDFVERETPAPGQQLTVMQQLLGNLGRFGGPAGGRGPFNRK
jgi:outer membrane protein assembly factor BamE (lipoprotein component of BamABCDE complex)